MSILKTTEQDPAQKGWWIYLIRTAQGSLYCGVTTDVARRFQEHQCSGAKAAKFLRGKGPLLLVFTHFVGEKRTAMALEWQIKKWPKAQKEALVECQCLLPKS